MSFLLSYKFKHFFYIFFLISGTFGNRWKASRTALSKEHECVTVILFQTNKPEQRVINDQLECNVHVVNVRRARTMDWQQALYFSPPLVSRFALLLCKMPHSSRLAHKVPVMQATQVITHQALNGNNRCAGTASPLDQNLILLLKAMIKYILML